ncbi:MAG: LytTR family DNA-binding domain-containing protein [Lachnospiraceae bacterium]|nr:LytTR family DNA-binding domain-containing protein [Lachnospiraceae bacterium]
MIQMYNIGICDDERDTCAQIADMIYEYDKRNKTGIEVSIWNTGEALYQDMLKNKSIDLLFLDIELVSTDGIQIGRQIRHELENQDICIVYISARSSYALELFKIHPIDFLIKPLSVQDISEAIDEALRLYRRSNTMFGYRADGYSCKIPYRKITYFYSENKKINMVTVDSTVQFTGKIKELAKTMPENFIQIHQSYIINMDHMNECSYETVKMSGGTELNISQPYRKQVRKHIMDYAWGQDC